VLGVFDRIRRFVEDLGRVKKLYPDVPGVARRMFITNSLDGLLAALGVDVGGYSPNIDPILMASSIMGGGIAMGIMSGMIGVYLSERAERIREVRDIEKKLSSKLKKSSIYWRAASLIPIYVALWSGVGIIMFPTLVALPYLLVSITHTGIGTAFIASIAIALILMGSLGAYLGKISQENVIYSTLRGLSLGVAAIVIVYLLKGVLGTLH